MNSSKRNICCVCLDAPTHFYGLWEFDAESVKWSKKLSYSVPEVVCIIAQRQLAFRITTLMLQDWLDHFLICMGCSEQVEKICAFKKLCLEADNLRKSLINKRKIPPAENSSAYVGSLEHIPIAECAASGLQANMKEESFSSDIPEQNVENETDPLMVVRVKVENIEPDNIKNECESLQTKCDNEDEDVDMDPLVNEASFQVNDYDCDDSEERNADIENCCKQCGFNYTLKDDLIEHVHTIHETYKCEFCENTLRGSNNFINHVSNTHLQKNETYKIFKCFTCKHRFSSATDLYHHNTTHSYACDLCRKGFKTKGALNVHKKHKHFNANAESNECVYYCKTCETHFSSYASLNLHNKSKHKDPETWKHTCKVCNRKFPAKQSYTLHMRRHLGVKPYSCHLCSKTYVSNDDLNKHITAHKNGHPGKCYYCDEEYKKRREMEQHIVKVHNVILQPARSNRVKKRVCHICSKGFYDNNQLSKHIRTHTGEKPFQCNECGKAFSDSANLGHHLQRMHNRTAKTNALI